MYWIKILLKLNWLGQPPLVDLNIPAHCKSCNTTHRGVKSTSTMIYDFKLEEKQNHMEKYVLVVNMKLWIL